MFRKRGLTRRYSYSYDVCMISTVWCNVISFSSYAQLNDYFKIAQTSIEQAMDGAKASFLFYGCIDLWEIVFTLYGTLLILQQAIGENIMWWNVTL